MPGSADFIQRAVHALEMGGLAIWIRRGLVAAIIVALGVYYFYHFRGLATSQAMDQAQIARAIAGGQGWSTNFARPLAIAQLRANKKDVARNIWIDSYNAPLPPLINAIPVLAVKRSWKMGPTDLIYSGDSAIVIMSMLLFLLSVAVLFFTTRRLFDQRLAILVCALILLCDMMWQYSLSGLPQMLLLLLFNCTLYALVRAVQAKYDGTQVRSWLAVAGLGFGLLALAHALTIWIFVAALIFCIFFFPPRGWAAAILLAVFAIIYVPWLIRTYAVSGNPGGIAIYSILDAVGGSESAWMRHLEFDFGSVGIGAFREKLTGNFFTATGHIFEYFGWSVVALTFFVALLHAFKRPDTGAVRWLILAMWTGALLGMTVYGLKAEQGFAANQLHLIFVPIMTSYGLAFLLVQWKLLDVKIPLARLAFITLLFLLCAFPMVNTMVLSGRKPKIVWPPYVPPYIGLLNTWMKPDEVIASDMPWAVAWYANRHSVWVPDTMQSLIELSDYNVLGGPINGLYLTSISGAQNNLRDIVKGEYKDWAPLIQRSVDLQKSPLPLKWPTLLGLDNECVFFSDHDRTQKPK
jgi:4-amino-4-deoxy-L-arabinose transferase-like glycosyltransferase